MIDSANTIKGKFKKFSTGRECRECSEKESRAYPTQDEWIYYKLIEDNSGFHLSFWIDSYAQKRSDLQKELKAVYDKNQVSVKRHFRWGTYYNANGLLGYNPILDENDLERDMAKLQEAIGPVLAWCNPGSPLVKTVDADLPVGICSETVEKILTWPLSVPNYQRGYCWKRQNILDMLNDVEKWQKAHVDESDMYNLGTIVLKATDTGYDIIDGQQRLITLALYARTKSETVCRGFNLGANNNAKVARFHLLQAREMLRSWHGAIDPKRLRLSVIVIGKKESEDLAFLFFSHLNSSGKRLSDYDLLKSHHLRYVKDDIAEVMARHWGELDNPSNPDVIRILLHNVLYRLRQWLVRETHFPYQADATEEHELFRHFSLDFEPIPDLCTPYKPTQLTSMLSGGLEFFGYVDYYHQKMRQFAELLCVKQLSPLQGHSYGTLYWGIYALAFMFFCKYGEIYLPDAIYAIAWQVSRLRNEVQLRRDYISQQTIFASVAAWIDQSTHESEFLGKALNSVNDYAIAQCEKGKTAWNYWLELNGVLEKLPANIVRNHNLEKDIKI